jgi:peptide chain release factor 1
VILKHLPSGLQVRCQTERSQFRNKQLALALLTARLQERSSRGAHAERSADRKEQLGAGQRGDKRRTIRVRDGQVKDHITGKTWRYADYIAGLL